MLVLPLAVPLILYVLLSLPSVQNSIAQRAEHELTALLGTDVHLGGVSVAPFNRIVLSDVSIKDPSGIEALNIGHIGAGISLMESLWGKRPLISYVELIDMDIKLYKDSMGAPLNIQPIIDRFKSDGNKPPTAFDLAVNLVVIRRSSLTYDVLDTPLADSARFDKNHISVSDFRADISAPLIANDRLSIDVKRLGAEERSGLSLKDFTVSVIADKDVMQINDFVAEIGHSRIAFNNLTIASPLGNAFRLQDAFMSPVETLPDTYLILSDLSPFVRELSGTDDRIDIDFELDGCPDSLVIRHFDVEIADRGFRFGTHGLIENLTNGSDSVVIGLRRVNLVANVGSVIGFMASPSGALHHLYEKLLPLRSLGNINLLGDMSLTSGSLDFNGSLDTDCGNLDLDCGIYKRGKNSPLSIDGSVNTSSFNPSQLLPGLAPLTRISFETMVDLVIGKKGYIKGSVELAVPTVEWNGFIFSDISAKARFFGDKMDGALRSASPGLDFIATGGADFTGEKPLNEFYAEIKNVSLAPFVKHGRFHDYSVAGGIDVSVQGRNPDTLTGWVKVEDIKFSGSDGKKLVIPYVELEASERDSLRLITLRSPQADADLSGRFSLKTLGKDIGNIVASVYPSLVKPGETGANPIDCRLNLTVKEDSALSQFFKLPVDFIYPVNVSSYANGGDNPTLGLSVDMPFLRNKNKLIEGSRLSLLVDGVARKMEFLAHTSFPTKDGKLDLDLKSMGHTDSIATDISWVVDRDKEFRGNLSFDTDFRRDTIDNRLLTDIVINKSKMVFNDSMWTVNPSRISIAPHRVVVDNLSGGRQGQSLSINGVASADSTELLVMKLQNIDLDYIFETLNIGDAVQFGGCATGDFYGLMLLSQEPVLYTPRLKVDGLKYNKCVMGDADIRSYWNHEEKSIVIKADIRQPNSDLSVIDGYIKPMTEELDFKFSAKNAPVGFMAPFMSAFTSKISGRVSGDAHLYGTFKDLDLKGDVFADNLSLKLDFTNTTYTATDSVHIEPGIIRFNDIRLTDRNNKVANLSGYVRHNYFHDASFKFDISDAKDFLVYDVSDNQTEDPWYGRIFGNGRAIVKGGPGHVDIDVDMSTAPNSNFTFVLSDAEHAMDYTFITLRDRDKAKKDSIMMLDPKQMIIRKMNERIRHDEEGVASVYSLTFKVGITPDATITLLMDPAGGDKITAHGNGNLRMTYTSDGDMKMYGNYTINRGKYNFTLQDIILKDFDIREGSKISFLGDPYAAQLDITASYSLNANLSELDESFLEDRELNRTNVRVDALMFVKGDIRQPDITFDLEFPSLSQEIYRKVRSIVSTEDMMNRQIIYLLALNKFYTPDYMTGTHGNELVSVASSTLSSRLGSMLGQLSDNWSIAPAIRSDRSDFSNVEVDVALSSHLLNNRLLLNGNLGYRDKSMNNNSFIGDFDIRYLLNRSGSIQLKAYNRYNDQNYYLKSALTTQGIGLVFKRDFDNIFSFLRRKKKGSDDKTKEVAKPDSVSDGVLEKRKRISTDSIFDSKLDEK
ncbi:MAG TPA: hypothetical protein DD424_02740 [Porphyromonadaceae bacterium]|nr:hypothetical protein [Porphyromonadaceae bacterium]